MKQQVISEEDFETLPGAGRPSPSINLGSHLPNPLNLILNPNKVPSSVTLSPSENNIIAGKKGMVSSAPVRDRINNVTQKEEAMASAGVTRLGTYKVIVLLLSATRWVDVTDAQGNVRRESVPDLAAQARGAELALKAFGDMIEHKEVSLGIADSTLEKLKAMSVAALRARAAELLEGRVKAVDVARFSVPVGAAAEAEVVG